MMFGGSFMMVGIMLFWVVLIAVGFYLLYRFINGRKEELSPIEILKVRLAKGEISLDEFEQLSKNCSRYIVYRRCDLPLLPFFHFI